MDWRLNTLKKVNMLTNTTKDFGFKKIIKTHFHKDSNFFITDKYGVKRALYAVTQFDEEINQTVIINESATGNGGVSYSNGRTQQSIPVNGIISEKNIVLLKAYKSWLKRIATNGETVNFQNIFSDDNDKSMKYIIKNLKFSYSHTGGRNSIQFSCLFTEKREYNVNKSAVYLVNNGYANFVTQYYKNTLQYTQ